MRRLRYKKILFLLAATLALVDILPASAVAIEETTSAITIEENDNENTYLYNLTDNDKFILGRSFFVIPWVASPSSTTARDGLGPLFNANTCMSCHENNGRGKVLNANGSLHRSNTIKISIPSDNSTANKEKLKISGLILEPNYGEQININAIYGVDFEAKPKINYKKLIFNYPDGDSVILKEPHINIENLNYGEMDENVNLSARIATSVIGLGLIEQISDAEILANEDIYDKDNDSISGKANKVWSRKNNTIEVGKYGWKASTSTITDQVAKAAHEDMGLTNYLYPSENCNDIKMNCEQYQQADFDLTKQRLEAISFYIQKLTTKRNNNKNAAGEKIFNDIDCSKCHTGGYNTAFGKIYPYSDFLLHDMGDQLGDNLTDFDATGNEWRTAPLWNIANDIKTLKGDINFLHDGRAKTIEEAILWHAGEANKSKELFVKLNKEQKNELINFIKNL